MTIGLASSRTRVLLIRHGATELSATHACGRAAGISLNDRGKLQVGALAKALPRLDGLWSSPITRAWETAEIIGRSNGQSPERAPAFTEFDFGQWSGTAFRDLQRMPEWQEFNTHREQARAPGGESMSEVQVRAMTALRDLIRRSVGQTIAIVTHADVIRAVVLALSGAPIQNFWRFEVSPASITEWSCGPEGDERLVRCNDCCHLPPNLIDGRPPAR